MGLRSRVRNIADRMKQSTLDIEREDEQQQQEALGVERLKSALMGVGFQLIRDQEFREHMGSRVIELKRRELVVRIDSDRGSDWEIAVAALPGKFWDVHLWREYLDGPDLQEDVPTFARQAEYLRRRLDRLDDLASDAHASAELAKRLSLMALDRAERRWPGSTRNMRLDEALNSLLAEAGDVTAQGVRPGPFEYSRGGVMFAALPNSSTIELKLGAEIADAAMRTPSTGPSPRGPDWITFAPPEWDQHARDRLEAWFRVAWRFAGDR